jgi:hypothetical protein
MPVTLLGDGSFVALDVPIVPYAVRLMEASGRAIVAIAKDGGRIDTITTLKYEHSQLTIQIKPGLSIHGIQPWGTPDMLAVAPNGGTFAVVRQSPERQQTAVHVEVYVGRRLEQEVTVPFTSHALTDDMVRQFVDSEVARIDGSGRIHGAITPAAVGAPLYRPETLPAVRRASVSDDGTVWLQEYGLGQEGKWRVVRARAKGHPVYDLVLPPNSVLLTVEPDRVWLLGPDGSGGQVIKVYLVDWS